jgi:hypothetical protein
MTILKASGPWCLATMGVPATLPLFQPANSYLGICLWAASAVLCIVLAEGAFRGYGSFLASLEASFINLILDPILMFTLGMGVAGAAAATPLEASAEQQSSSLLLATKRNHFNTVQVLIQSGCKVFVTDVRGRTAREIALQRGNQALVELCDRTCPVDRMQHLLLDSSYIWC